jgi:hypothetical protein
MIRPIYFDSDEYFDPIQIDRLISENYPDISPGKSFSGSNQCILQLTLTQIHDWGPWGIDDIETIHIKDVISGNYDQNIYLEIPTAFWLCLKDRTIFRHKNILITNHYEAWLRGLPIAIEDDIECLTDIDVVEDLLLAKNHVVIRDNNVSIDAINCIPYPAFYREARDMITDGTGRHDWIPWCTNYHKFVNDNIDHLPNKEKTYTALLGYNKMHRDDLNNRLTQSSVEGYLGGFNYGELKDDLPVETRHDRYIAKNWLWNSKVWISAETHPALPGANPNTYNVMASLTEKTWKPICMGMPFLMVNHPDCISYLEDMGFNPFIEVFGNYIDADYVNTNKNIVHILENFEDYDITKIQDICRKNFERFCEHDTPSMHDTFMARLGISYN